jgi:chromosome segregation ATPase
LKRKRHQEAVDKSEENVQTIETCKIKIAENIQSEKQEIIKRVSTKKRIENLAEEIKVLKEKRVEVGKEFENVQNENEVFQAKLDDKTLKYNIETTKLTDIYEGKLEKLEKIAKKNKEKEVDIEEMLRHKKQVESKIEKEQRNKERILDEQSRIEDELSATNTTHANALKASNTMQNDQDKELKRLEQRESILKVGKIS